MEDLEMKQHVFPRVGWKLDQIDHNGMILDIGVGGEGVIG